MLAVGVWKGLVGGSWGGYGGGFGGGVRTSNISRATRSFSMRRCSGGTALSDMMSRDVSWVSRHRRLQN